MDHHHHHHHVHWTTITITIMYHNGTSSSSPLWSLRFHWTSIRKRSRLGSRKASQQKTLHFSFFSEEFASDIWVGHWSFKAASDKFVLKAGEKIFHPIAFFAPGAPLGAEDCLRQVIANASKLQVDGWVTDRIHKLWSLSQFHLKYHHPV